MKTAKKILHLGALSILLVGCSSDAPSLAEAQKEEPWKKINNWIIEEPRDIVVRVDAELPGHRIEVHESQAWQGAGRGAAEGAVGSLYGGAQTGDPWGLVLGVVLMPVFALGGAIYGAIDAEPAIHYQSIQQVAGTEPMFQAASRGADLRKLLKDRVSTALYKQTRSDITFSRSNKKITPQFLADADVLIGVTLRRYDLIGDIEENPSVKLIIEGDTIVGVQELDAGFTCPWSYESEERRVSEWAKNDAEIFRNEIHLAAEQISRELTVALRDGDERCKPSSSYLNLQASWESCYPALADASRLDTSTQQRRAKLCSGYGRSVVWRWYCLAAQQGDPDSQFKVGESYRLGHQPVERDAVKAYQWYILASTQDHKASSNELARLTRQLTASQVAEAGNLAAAWSPKTEQCEKMITVHDGLTRSEQTTSASTVRSHSKKFNQEWIIAVVSSPITPTKRVRSTSRPRRILTACSGSDDRERPWVGRWEARTDIARFTFDIEEEAVQGRVKFGSKEFTIQGKVDESGVIDAKIFGRGSEGGPVDVRGTFPHLQLAYPYAQGPLFKALDGQTIRLCS